MEECVHGHVYSTFQQKQTGMFVQIKRHNSKVEKVVKFPPSQSLTLTLCINLKWVSEGELKLLSGNKMPNWRKNERRYMGKTEYLRCLAMGAYKIN